MALHVDRFAGPTLDRTRWLPHYLPAWSSRAATAATYRVGDGLTLEIPVEAPLWCPELHRPPLRVSGLQSGNWSGPAGSPFGQQRFRDGLAVREPQERFDGWLLSSGQLAVRARMEISPRSMAAVWLSGFEDDPDQLQCGEICVVEVFGRSVGSGPDGPSAEVGVGIKPFRDPALADDFAAPRIALDVRETHAYAVEWDAAEAVFTLDGTVVRRCDSPPTYPLQIMVAVFDFPEWSTGADDHLVPRLVVEEISGTARGGRRSADAAGSRHAHATSFVTPRWPARRPSGCRCASR